MYLLHPTLAADSIHLGQLTLCDVLLANNKTYPWLILVPKRHDIKEIYELSLEDQQQLIEESSIVAKKLAQHYQADKINIAAFGNQVPQLHMHIMVRFKTDPAWPNPIWLNMQPVNYNNDEQAVLAETLRQLLDLVTD